MAKLLKDNDEYKVGGQWSPAFVFNNNGYQSFPIIPKVYNENIIDELSLRFIFIEKNQEEAFKRLLKDYKNISVIDSFFVAGKYVVNLYDLKQ